MRYERGGGSMGIYGRGAKGRCDKLFSRIVRSSGQCVRCGSKDNLQCAHIITRKYSATRTDLTNAWSLCARCHRRLTDFPREHSHFITETIGSTKYEELREKAETITKMDWDAEYERLKTIAKKEGIK